MPHPSHSDKMIITSQQITCIFQSIEKYTQLCMYVCTHRLFGVSLPLPNAVTSPYKTKPARPNLPTFLHRFAHRADRDKSQSTQLSTNNVSFASGRRMVRKAAERTDLVHPPLPFLNVIYRVLGELSAQNNGLFPSFGTKKSGRFW